MNPTFSLIIYPCSQLLTIRKSTKLSRTFSLRFSVHSFTQRKIVSSHELPEMQLRFEQRSLYLSTSTSDVSWKVKRTSLDHYLHICTVCTPLVFIVQLCRSHMRRSQMRKFKLNKNECEVMFPYRICIYNPCISKGRQRRLHMLN